MRATFDLAGGEFAEPPLDEDHPRRAGRREVQQEECAVRDVLAMEGPGFLGVAGDASARQRGGQWPLHQLRSQLLPEPALSRKAGPVPKRGTYHVSAGRSGRRLAELGCESALRPTPSPEAYNPHSAWLNDTRSPSFG